MNGLEGVFIPADPFDIEIDTIQNRSNLTFDDDVPINFARIKLGEVFQISKKCYAFVCVHCSKEFSHFTEFTLHTEKHLLKAMQELTELKETTRNETVDHIKSEIIEEEVRNNYEVMDSAHPNENDTNFFMDDYNANDSDSDYFNDNLTSKISIAKVPNTKKTPNIVSYAEGKDFKKVSSGFECSICKRRTKHKRGMKEHLSIHTNTEKIIKCPLCDQKFTLVRYVRKHIAGSHKKKYTSDMIRKAQTEFVETQNTFQEKRCSTKKVSPYAQAKFECFICKKRLLGKTTAKTVYNIRFHIKTVHNPVKNFECYLCKRRCCSKKLLKEHMKCHIEGPLLCLLCGLFFRNPSSLKCHIKNHDIYLNKPFKCRLCARAYINKRNLFRHFKKNHPNEVQ